MGKGIKVESKSTQVPIVSKNDTKSRDIEHITSGSEVAKKKEKARVQSNMFCQMPSVALLIDDTIPCGSAGADWLCCLSAHVYSSMSMFQHMLMSHFLHVTSLSVTASSSLSKTLEQHNRNSHPPTTITQQ
jgi:hypothetical protein